MTHSVAVHDIPGALDALDEHGFVVLENAISEEKAKALAGLVVKAPDRVPGVKGWEAYVCLLNFDARFVELALHPSVLSITHHLLGGRTEPLPNAFAWPARSRLGRLRSVYRL